MAAVSWSVRWNRIRTQLTLRDLLLDVTGKTLAALGIGALFAPTLQPHAGVLVVLGLAVSLAVKAKYWKRFWE